MSGPPAAKTSPPGKAVRDKMLTMTHHDFLAVGSLNSRVCLLDLVATLIVLRFCLGKRRVCRSERASDPAAQLQLLLAAVS